MKRRERIRRFIEWSKTTKGKIIYDKIVGIERPTEVENLLMDLVAAKVLKDNSYPGCYLTDKYCRSPLVYSISRLLTQADVWPECWPESYAKRKIAEWQSRTISQCVS